MLQEERELDRIAEPRTGFRLPAERAVRVSIAARPPAMRPRAEGDVVVRTGSESLDAAERSPWSGKIFGVVRAADFEHRGNALHMPADVARLPIRVIARVTHHDIPQRRGLGRQ